MLPLRHHRFLPPPPKQRAQQEKTRAGAQIGEERCTRKYKAREELDAGRQYFGVKKRGLLDQKKGFFFHNIDFQVGLRVLLEML